MSQTVGLPLRRSLRNFLRFELNDQEFDQLPWRKFDNGLSMCRLARVDACELVLYRIPADASPDVFLKHEHVGGEFYLVIKGKIIDETGEYQEGDAVFLRPKSTHAPRAVGDTVVLVFWPAGVRVVE